MRILIPAACLIVLAGCAGSDSNTPAQADTQPQESAQDQARMANPASVFCVEQGGRVEIRNSTEGQSGYCHLPDGTVVEEWEYFRANNSAE